MIGAELLSLKQRQGRAGPGRAGSGRVGPGRAAILISSVRESKYSLSLVIMFYHSRSTHNTIFTKFLSVFYHIGNFFLSYIDSTAKNKTFFISTIFSKNQYLRSQRAIFKPHNIGKSLLRSAEAPAAPPLRFARNEYLKNYQNIK